MAWEKGLKVRKCATAWKKMGESVKKRTKSGKYGKEKSRIGKTMFKIT